MISRTEVFVLNNSYPFERATVSTFRYAKGRNEKIKLSPSCVQRSLDLALARRADVEISSGPKLLRDDIASPVSQSDLISSNLSRSPWPFVGPSAEHRHSANKRAFWAVGICAGAREEVSLATAKRLNVQAVNIFMNILTN